MEKQMKSFFQEMSKIVDEIQKRQIIDNKLDICTLCDKRKFLYFVEDIKGNNKRWIIWLDILGFKEIVLSWDKEKIFKLLSFIKNFFTERYLSKEVYIFSDTIIVTSQIGEEDLIFILESIAILQIQLIDAFNIFIRGSISIGEIFSFYESYGSLLKQTNSLFLFGKGVIEAYILEQKAKYPIIVLDNILSNVIDLTYNLAENPDWQNKYPEDYENGFLKIFYPQGDSDFSFLKNRLLKNMISRIKIKNNKNNKNKNIKNNKNNIYYFVDYLKQLYNIETEPNIIDFIQLHKDLLIKNYYKNKNTPKIRNKYKWLINYHNSRVPSEFKIKI